MLPNIKNLLVFPQAFVANRQVPQFLKAVKICFCALIFMPVQY